jgi:hypothetical protein
MFTGPLHPLSNMISLRIVYLNNNAFTWPINPKLWALPDISVLRLNTNNLSGNLPVVLRSALRELDVRKNLFGGQIPQGFFNWPGLNFLDMSANRFSGRIPWEFEQLNIFTTSESSKEHSLPSLLTLYSHSEDTSMDFINTSIVSSPH